MRFWDTLDPRARLLIVLAATVACVSVPRGELQPYALFFPAILLLMFTSRSLDWVHILTRCAASSPFILLAGLMLLFQYGIDAQGRPEGLIPVAGIIAKGYSAALLLAFLGSSTGLAQILWAMRKLGAPESLNMILAMMFRYTSLLSEEWQKLQRARDSRTVRPLQGLKLANVYGRQLGTLLVRSWDRADRIHAAMLSRGFHGVWPVREQSSWHMRDTLAVVLIPALFVAIRLFR